MKPSFLAAVLLGAALTLAHANEQPGAAPEHAAEPAAMGDAFTGGNAEAGATKATPCFACHGPAGNSGNPEWPKLAGQSGTYIVEQLKLFKSGARKNPVMQPQAAQLSDEDMRDLAAFFAMQKTAPGVASADAVKMVDKLYRAGDASRGLPACSACHGPTGAGNAAAGYPRIGKQNSKYVANALRQLRAAVGAPVPVNTQTMAGIASRLTDNEIEALASYVNGLQ